MYVIDYGITRMRFVSKRDAERVINVLRKRGINPTRFYYSKAIKCN